MTDPWNWPSTTGHSLENLALLNLASGDWTGEFREVLHFIAMAASGITGGCGGGNFCPTNVVTREQMAAFLARALGLHWDGF